MGSMSIMHWAVVLILVLVLFGRNKISAAMQDLGGGLREFKKGLREAGSIDQISVSGDRSQPSQTETAP